MCGEGDEENCGIIVVSYTSDLHVFSQKPVWAETLSLHNWESGGGGTAFQIARVDSSLEKHNILHP